MCTLYIYANGVATSFAFPENRYVLFYLLLVGCSQFLFRFLSPYWLVRFQFVHRFYSNEVFLLLTCENFNAYTVSEAYVCENGLLATIQYIRYIDLISWKHFYVVSHSKPVIINGSARMDSFFCFYFIQLHLQLLREKLV